MLLLNKLADWPPNYKKMNSCDVKLASSLLYHEPTIVRSNFILSDNDAEAQSHNRYISALAISDTTALLMGMSQLIRQ